VPGHLRGLVQELSFCSSLALLFPSSQPEIISMGKASWQRWYYTAKLGGKIEHSKKAVND